MLDEWRQRVWGVWSKKKSEINVQFNWGFDRDVRIKRKIRPNKSKNGFKKPHVQKEIKADAR